MIYTVDGWIDLGVAGEIGCEVEIESTEDVHYIRRILVHFYGNKHLSDIANEVSQEWKDEFMAELMREQRRAA